MSEQTTFFADSGLPPALGDNLLRFNPWWEGEAMPPQPATRRHLVGQMRRRLDAGIAPVVVVRGPRQIGKTTAQFQMIQDLLDEGVNPRRILRVQFDDLETMSRLPEPILRISDWFERRVAPKRFNSMASDGEPAYLFFDEIQNLKRWDGQLKSLVDNASVRVVVTGSSALRIELGRDSLAGRINTIEAGVLSLTEIGALRGLGPPAPFFQDNGLGDLLQKGFWAGLREYGIDHGAFREEAFLHFSERGGYPLVHREKDLEFAQLSDQLNETVIKRVIQHDLRTGERGRKRDENLLEELFRLVCRYAGQTPRTATLAEGSPVVAGCEHRPPSRHPVPEIPRRYAPAAPRASPGDSPQAQAGQSQALPGRPRAQGELASGAHPPWCRGSLRSAPSTRPWPATWRSLFSARSQRQSTASTSPTFPREEPTRRWTSC